MNNILFFPLTKTNWPIMFRLATAMQESGKAKPILVVSNKLIANLVRDISSNLEIVEIGKFQRASQSKLMKGAGKKIFGRRLIGLVKARLAKVPGLREIFVMLKKKEILSLADDVTCIFNKYSPSAVVVAGDRNSGVEPCVIKISNMRQIPLIIPPIAFAATTEGLLIVRREHPGHIVTNDFLFKKKFSGQWIVDPISHEDVSFFSTPLTYAYSQLNMLPPRPWVMGAGLTNWILADSQFVKDRYVESRVPANKIVITGHMDHDWIAASIEEREEIRKRLNCKYQLCVEKKIIMLPLPNWVEHNYMPEEWHWAECEFLCEIASKQNVNVLIPLHPTQTRENYLRLETKFQMVRVLEESVSNVLGVADIFLTGLGSSTVLWAVMAAIPVVIADHYHEKDHMHMGLPGVAYVENKEILGDMLSRLLNDDCYCNSIKNEQKKVQPYFGRTDGRSTQRIIEFICGGPVHSGREG